MYDDSMKFAVNPDIKKALSKLLKQKIKENNS